MPVVFEIVDCIRCIDAEMLGTNRRSLQISLMEKSTRSAWVNQEHATAYLQRADEIPHRKEGEAVLLELLPGRIERVLDIGTGDGRLLAMVLTVHPDAEGVAIEFSPTMLKAVRERFAGSGNLSIVEHNFEQPLPQIGPFDAIVSSFAIHHVADSRKKKLYAEVFSLLQPGGLFANLEHVCAPTPKLRDDFFRALGTTLAEEDATNKCSPVEPQLQWLREIGFEHVDCFWKWREMALLAGQKPAA